MGFCVTLINNCSAQFERKNLGGNIAVPYDVFDRNSGIALYKLMQRSERRTLAWSEFKAVGLRSLPLFKMMVSQTGWLAESASALHGIWKVSAYLLNLIVNKSMHFGAEINRN